MSKIDFSGLTIFLADDNKMYHDILHKLLRESYCEIITFENGKELYEYVIENNTADILIIDIQMPIMDGLTAIKKIREFEKEGGIAEKPCFAISSFNSEKDKQEALLAGFNEIIPKPINKLALLELISEYSTK